MDDIKSLWKEIGKKGASKRTTERILNQLKKKNISDVSYLLDQQYLKDQLWPYIHRDISKEFLLSIVYLINYSSSPFDTLKDLIVDHNSRFSLLVYRILSYINTDNDLDLEIFSFLLTLTRNINYAPIGNIIIPLFSVLIEKDELKQCSLKDVDKEDAYLLAGFFKHFITSAIKGDDALLEFKILILINLLSYLPVRKYVNNYLKKINLLVKLDDRISEDLQSFLSYLIYYPVDDKGEALGSQAEIDSKNLKNFNKFLAIAHSEFRLNTLTQYGNVFEFITDFDSFSQCFSDVPLETILKLSHRCGIENMESMSKNSMVKSIWYNYCYSMENKSMLLCTSKLTDINRKYAKEIGKTLGFLNLSDFIYRSVLSLRLNMQYELLNFIKLIQQRMKILRDQDGKIKANGSSIYCVQMSSINEIDSSNAFVSDNLMERKCIRILINFKGKDHNLEDEFMKLNIGDAIFLIKFVPGLDKFARGRVLKINSHQKRQYQIDLSIDKMNNGNIIEYNFILRANESLEYLNGKFDIAHKLYKFFDFRLPKWLENIFVGYCEFESPKDYPIYIKLNTAIKGTFLENLVTFSDSSRKRRKTNTQKNKNVMVRESWMLEILSFSKHVRSIEEINWQCFNESEKSILNERQLRALIDSLALGMTLIEGPTNSGKTFVSIEIIKHILSNFNNERSLIIASTAQKRDDILNRLKEVEQISNSIIFSSQQQMNSVIEEYNNLLDKVDEFAKLLNIEGAFGNDNNSTRFFYQKYFSGIWTKLLESLKDKKHHTNEYLLNNYPFSSFARIDSTLSFEKNFEQVVNDYNNRLQVFRDIEKLKYVRQVRDKKENMILSISKYTKIFVFTRDEIMCLDKKWTGNWKYNNVIMLDSEANDAIETFLSISAQSNLESLTRMILIGNSALDNKQNSLFYKLLKSHTFCKLETQYSVRSEICRLSNSKLKIVNAIEHANPGLKYPLQFVDVDNGKEIERHFPAFIEYQNLTEAEYVVSFLTYLKAMNYSAKEICIITPFKFQKLLIKEIIDQKYMDYETANIPVLELQEIKSRKYKYVIVSLVRTNKNEDSFRRGFLNVLTNSATHGLYIFGSASVFNDIFSKFHDTKSKLQLSQSGDIDYEISGHEQLAQYVKNIPSV